MRTLILQDIHYSFPICRAECTIRLPAPRTHLKVRLSNIAWADLALVTCLPALEDREGIRYAFNPSPGVIGIGGFLTICAEVKGNATERFNQVVVYLLSMAAPFRALRVHHDVYGLFLKPDGEVSLLTADWTDEV